MSVFFPNGMDNRLWAVSGPMGFNMKSPYRHLHYIDHEVTTDARIDRRARHLA